MPAHQEVSLHQAISGRLLVVPDYQRPYAWEKTQLDDLWEDIDLLGRHGRHYTGTLVLKSREEPSVLTSMGQSLTLSDVVDGQQRLTTCFILLDRLRRAFETLAEEDVEDAAETAVHIRTSYGLVKIKRADQPRLQLGKELNAYWVDTVLGDHPAGVDQLTSGHERLCFAAEYFDQQITNLVQDVEADIANERLRELLERVTSGLKFLVYEVDSAAEVGVIFETLNGRGKPLSELEKIKNYLLFLVRTIPDDRADQLASLVNEKWAQIFADLAGLGVDEDRLLRAHWLATRDPIPKSWHGAASIKGQLARSDYVRRSDRLSGGTNARDDEQLVNDLALRVESYVRELQLCALYLRETYDPAASLADLKSDRENVRRRSAALRRGRNVATFQPLLFACRLKHPDDGAAYAELLRACETYAARVFTIAQRRSNAGQSTLYRIAFRIFEGSLTVAQAVREIDGLTWSYADDDRVTGSLTIGEDWYHRRGHKYFLYEYELHLIPAGALQPNYSDFTGERFNQTTEHILPQGPDWQSSDWGQSFSKEQHLALVHSLGNLVLTLDNSSYSNKEFGAKKGSAMSAGPCYATSSLRQEQLIARNDHWSPATIEDRLAALRVFALQRWPLTLPSTDTAEAVVQLRDSVPELDDDDDGVDDVDLT